MQRLMRLLVVLMVLCPVQAAANGTMWMSPEEIAALPTEGPAWEQIVERANTPGPGPDLNSDTNRHNIFTLARALVAARLGLDTLGSAYRVAAAAGIASVVGSESDSVVARDPAVNVLAYVVTADLIDYAAMDPVAELAFRTWLTDLRYLCFGTRSFWSASEDRPNNWGLSTLATRLGIAIYLADHGGAPQGTCASFGACNRPDAEPGCADPEAEIARVADLMKAWLGDAGIMNVFEYRDLWWQADPMMPVGINPVGATIAGSDVDGVLADDQRRCGPFRWPPPKENYVYEALQAVSVIATMLDRRGHDVWHWQDDAIKRAFDWLHLPHFAPSGERPYRARGDDKWIPHLVNHYYGSRFPADLPAKTGKNMGYTDWTHAGVAPAVGCLTSCDDGEACNGFEYCVGVECRPGRPAVTCDDAEPCTVDTCDAIDGCVHTAVTDGIVCDDGNDCTNGDTCLVGSCVGTRDPLCTTTTTLSGAPMCGDVTGNGEVTVQDALVLLHLANVPGGCDLSICDVDGNGAVTPTDALLVLVFVTGGIAELDCGGAVTALRADPGNAGDGAQSRPSN